MATDLLDILNRLIPFLRDHGEQHWSSELESYRERVSYLRPDDVLGWQRLLNVRMFGGMGALDDLALTQANGFTVVDEVAANQRLQSLVRELAQAVFDLRQKFGLPPHWG